MVTIWTDVLEIIKKCDNRTCCSVVGSTNAEMELYFFGRLRRLGAYDLYRNVPNITYVSWLVNDSTVLGAR